MSNRVGTSRQLVIGYEEPRLHAQFGERYEAYRRTVSRWIPHPPRANS